MKILHVCLSSSYTDGMKYQDNQLAEAHCKQGHQVVVVSNCNEYLNGKIRNVYPSDKILSSGIRLIRIKFANFLFQKISNKIQYSPDLKNTINFFQPDVIFYHSFVGIGMRTVVNYKKSHPQTRLIFDSHADFHNSTKNTFLNFIYYKLIMGRVIKNVIRYADKIYYVSLECRDYLRLVLGLDDVRMEFLPLGGTPFDPKLKLSARVRLNAEYGLNSEDIIFVHSGKIDASKKTIDIVNSFDANICGHQKLFIVGDIAENVDNLLEKIERNSNIFYVGWKSGDELEQYLLAADVYLQPGTQSATLQHAICCGCAVGIFPYESHALYINKNGFYIKDTHDIKSILLKIECGEIDLYEMKRASYQLSSEILDYSKMARKVIE